MPRLNPIQVREIESLTQGLPCVTSTMKQIFIFVARNRRSVAQLLRAIADLLD